MAFEIVDRPTSGSKYSMYYTAILDTLTTQRAIRCDLALPRTAVIAIGVYFKRHHPTLRVMTRRRPDGLYLWAELRNTNGAVGG